MPTQMHPVKFMAVFNRSNVTLECFADPIWLSFDTHGHVPTESGAWGVRAGPAINVAPLDHFGGLGGGGLYLVAQLRCGYSAAFHASVGDLVTTDREG